MKYILPLLLLAILSLSAGCASVIGIVSEEGLKNMEPPRRVNYRSILDDAGVAIENAKSEYDERYDENGEPILVNPLPEPEPVE